MNFKTPLGRLLQLAGLGVIVYFIFQNLYHNWTQVSEYTWRFDLFRLVLSVLLLFVVLGSMIPIWRIILRWMSYDLPMRIAWRIWFVSNLGRYLPGKVWQVVGMVYLCEKEGIPKRVTGLSIVLAQALSTLSAAGLFGLYLAIEGNPIEQKWTTLLLIILGGGLFFFTLESLKGRSISRSGCSSRNRFTSVFRSPNYYSSQGFIPWAGVATDLPSTCSSHLWHRFHRT